ncbi:MAG: isoprenylcysteine carboxylmethyltransferase family protein, partial [Chthoniobacteraceae bacterium]
ETPRAASGTAVSPGLVKAALAVEKYALPWAYIFLALLRVDALVDHYDAWRWTADGAFAPLVKDALLILLMLFTAVALFFSRPPVAVPDKLDQVLIPIAMSYYFFLYGLVDRLPAALHANLIPPAMQGSAAFAGFAVSIAGYAIAIWALCHLGRSFAILVAVRKVVTTGPYARVRHPIYLGYVFDLCGLLLASGSVAMLALGAGFLALLRLRARLEEEKLAGADAGYREYVARTGFLFPRF